MFDELLVELKKGIHVTEYRIKGRNLEDGRIRGQKYLDLHLSKAGVNKRLMRVSIYRGREPYYKPWVEMFGIRRPLLFGDEKLEYFGSRLEDGLLDIFTDRMDKGSRIFVEYQNDDETRDELSSGVPETCTRLGFKLFKRDFTWFKDWYFSEGFHEGNQKLQAEKPIDEEHEENHHQRIKEEIDSFLNSDFEENKYYRKAEERAKYIIKNYRNIKDL
ncbi:MAG: DUF1122 family protein [Candidatus Thermoplasmatota archaeon]|nr:DUF1122 family protein [Candidatus Thermoplasmatota archaeon]MBS3790223.1 DUF1122 family protein [Candidatus Thermoplasmatota archaeon]